MTYLRRGPSTSSQRTGCVRIVTSSVERRAFYNTFRGNWHHTLLPGVIPRRAVAAQVLGQDSGAVFPGISQSILSTVLPVQRQRAGNGAGQVLVQSADLVILNYVDGSGHGKGGHWGAAGQGLQ